MSEIEIVTDISAAPREAREHNPVLARAISHYSVRSAFWRWLTDGKNEGAKLAFRKICQLSRGS